MREILVTGASRGIGFAITTTFLENGDRVYACARDVQSLYELKEKYTLLEPISCDLKDPSSVEKMFIRIGEMTHQLDAVINNAGISKIGLLQDMSVEEWDELMAVNLRAPFLVIRKALPGMIRAGKGCIVNISSMWGTYGASCESAYSASKGGLNALTRALAKEVAPSGIRVNAITLGAIDTSMNAFLSPEERADLENEIGMGRLGSPREAADLVMYLCSDQSTYMTGAVIPLDGGF